MLLRSYALSVAYLLLDNNLVALTIVNVLVGGGGRFSVVFTVKGILGREG